MLSHSKVSMFLHLNLQPHHRRANIGSDLSHIQRTFQKQSTVYRAYQSTFDTAKGNRSDCLNGPPGLCPAFISVAGSVISPPPPPASTPNCSLPSLLTFLLASCSTDTLLCQQVLVVQSGECCSSVLLDSRVGLRQGLHGAPGAVGKATAPQATI